MAVVGSKEAAYRDEGAIACAFSQCARDLEAVHRRLSPADVLFSRDAQNRKEPFALLCEKRERQQCFFSRQIRMRMGEKAAEVSIPDLILDQEDDPRRWHVFSLL